ncbi:MAG TPA: DUF4129 domain-containing protein [Candidatus Sulfotelmatobacter sp.]|nr:DUF4129 domain-containing protein [Candidatus Sulfotelmatobacter sp.]
MTARRSSILACLLMVAVSCRADSAGNGALTTAEYRAELDSLLAATQQRDSSGGPTPQPLHDLPQSWRVATDQREFEISTEGLQRDVRRYEKEKNVANASAIRTRLQSLRSDLDGFEKPPADVSANRAELSSILARREFRDVQGPSWFDRLKQRLLEFILHFLERLIRSAAIPTISKYFVYGLMGVAVLALAFIAYRSLWSSDNFETVVPKDLPVSAKEWAIWLSEARAAAAKGEWREAIHLAYWAGISFLERQGMWKPDRARTPREYLRLLSSASEHRETLTALTRIFELAWYANRGASERTFSQTLAELEKLGCR